MPSVNYHPTMVCGQGCTFCIDENYNLLSFGGNTHGKLGHVVKHSFIFPNPKIITGLSDIKMVACGDIHTVCVDSNGNLFTFGSNRQGELGTTSVHPNSVTHVPQRIDITSIKQISCGYSFTVVLSTNDLLYSFGSNSKGELGHGTITNCSTPKLITGIEHVNFFECGGNHVICKTEFDEYYSWGFNKYGQLGQGNYDESYNKPHKCSNWPDDIIDIKCGYNHNLILTSSGFVYSFGSNNDGQLGLNDESLAAINIPILIKNIPSIKRIECGLNHSMCIDINDKLWVFGFNYYGQLGLGDTKKRHKPTLNESVHDIIDISSPKNHTFIKTIDNKIYAFGNNEYSQLGIKTSENYQLQPIQVFKDAEDIWTTNIRSKQKSARN